MTHTTTTNPGPRLAVSPGSFTPGNDSGSVSVVSMGSMVSAPLRPTVSHTTTVSTMPMVSSSPVPLNAGDSSRLDSVTITHPQLRVQPGDDNTSNTSGRQSIDGDSIEETGSRVHNNNTPPVSVTSAPTQTPAGSTSTIISGTGTTNATIVRQLDTIVER